MKKITYLIAATFLLAMGCSQNPSSAPGGTKLTLSTLPTPDGGDSHSITDIPTPSFNGNTISTGSISGHKICLTWQSNSPDHTTFDYSTGTDPTTPTALNVDASGHDYGWEYWGCTQNAIVIYNNGGQPAYSGHYELTWSWVDVNNVSQSVEQDVTGDSYCVDNLSDGTYTFTLKAKSNEGSTPNTMTHHSNLSTGYAVTVTSCTEVPMANTYAINPVSGGNGTWSTNALYVTSTNMNGNVWTVGSAHVNDNTNILYNIYEWTNTQSCTNAITSTAVSGGYTGSLYLSRDGGTTWCTEPAWSVLDYYQANSNYQSGNLSGLGKLSMSGSPYTVIYSSTNNISGELGTFTVVVP